MNLQTIFFVVATSLFAALDAILIDHDKVQPFPQPEPVTESEKAAVKFKPQLKANVGCSPFPAVNAAGETSGGLKGTGGSSGCKVSLLGSQVYGRAAWHNDIWAIMYAWYFPKGFWIDIPVRRHDWKNVIVWIDNPAVEAPKILGISTYHGSDYGKIAPVSDAGTVDGSTPKFFVRVPPFLSDTYIISTTTAGDFQDLIMWDQLTDAARAALNTTDFGKAKVPFIDENFSEKLEDAWPF